MDPAPRELYALFLAGMGRTSDEISEEMEHVAGFLAFQNADGTELDEAKKALSECWDSRPPQPVLDDDLAVMSTIAMQACSYFFLFYFLYIGMPREFIAAALALCVAGWFAHKMALEEGKRALEHKKFVCRMKWKRWLVKRAEKRFKEMVDVELTKISS